MIVFLRRAHRSAGDKNAAQERTEAAVLREVRPVYAKGNVAFAVTEKFEYPLSVRLIGYRDGIFRHARREGRRYAEKLLYDIAVEPCDILVLGGKGYLGDGKHSAEEQHSVGSCLSAAVRKHRHLRELLLDIR